MEKGDKFLFGTAILSNNFDATRFDWNENRMRLGDLNTVQRVYMYVYIYMITWRFKRAYGVFANTFDEKNGRVNIVDRVE